MHCETYSFSAITLLIIVLLQFSGECIFYSTVLAKELSHLVKDNQLDSMNVTLHIQIKKGTEENEHLI